MVDSFKEVGKLWNKYKLSIISAILVSILFFVSILIFGELRPEIAAIGGLLFTIPIRFFWHSYMSPVLKVKENPECRSFHLNDYRWEYLAYRIIVENSGRRAAKNCKGYIMIGGAKERVCWTVSKERPNATINAKDEEKLDFCAFYKSGPSLDDYTNPIVDGKKQKIRIPKIIAPTEEGWPQKPLECTRLDGTEECEVLITADNAEPIDAKIRFNVDKIEILKNDSDSD